MISRIAAIARAKMPKNADETSPAAENTPASTNTSSVDTRRDSNGLSGWLILSTSRSK